VLVNTQADYTRQVADFARADPAAAAAGIRVNQDKWKLNDGTSLEDVFLEGPRQALADYLTRLPQALRVPAGHQLILHGEDAGRHRTLYLDHGHSVEVTRVVDADVFQRPTSDGDWFEVRVALDPALGARMDELTRSHVGHKVAVIFDEDDLWGAPVIRMPFSTHVSVTARGSEHEAQQLAAGFRAGGLPARLQLLTEDIFGPAAGTPTVP
jgi:preprotein translocase subunit SecD